MSTCWRERAGCNEGPASRGHAFQRKLGDVPCRGGVLGNVFFKTYEWDIFQLLV